jgi:hypothetical protein
MEAPLMINNPNPPSPSSIVVGSLAPQQIQAQPPSQIPKQPWWKIDYGTEKGKVKIVLFSSIFLLFFSGIIIDVFDDGQEEELHIEPSAFTENVVIGDVELNGTIIDLDLESKTLRWLYLSKYQEGVEVYCEADNHYESVSDLSEDDDWYELECETLNNEGMTIGEQDRSWIKIEGDNLWIAATFKFEMVEVDTFDSTTEILVITLTILPLIGIVTSGIMLWRISEREKSQEQQVIGYTEDSHIGESMGEPRDPDAAIPEIKP